MRSATALTMSTDGSEIVSRSRVAALCPLRFASSHGRALVGTPAIYRSGLGKHAMYLGVRSAPLSRRKAPSSASENCREQKPRASSSKVQINDIPSQMNTTQPLQFLPNLVGRDPPLCARPGSRTYFFGPLLPPPPQIFLPPHRVMFAPSSCSCMCKILCE